MAAINSPSNPSAIAEVDLASKAVRVTQYDSTGAEVSGLVKGTSWSSWFPDPTSVAGGAVAVNIDTQGNLHTRGPVITDEGAISDCFPGVALTTALTGTVKLTSATTAVVGFGSSFTTQVKARQYLKFASDDELLYCQVASVESDTALTLASPYAGGTNTAAAVVSNWSTEVGNGGIAVSNSFVYLTGGLTAGSPTLIFIDVDWSPLQAIVVANYQPPTGTSQTSQFGFVDNPASVAAGAYIQFDPNLANNQVRVVTMNTAGVGGSQSYVAQLPAGMTTNQNITYKLTVSQFDVIVEVGQPIQQQAYQFTQIARLVMLVPNAYEELFAYASTITTGAGVTTSGSLNIDTFYVNDTDRVEVVMSLPTQPLPVLSMPAQASGAEDMTGKQRHAPDTAQLTSPQPNYALARTKIAVGPVGEDHGDATDNCPLAVKDAATQDLYEYSLLEQRRLNIATARTRQSEREAPYFLNKTGRDGRF